MGVTDPGVVPQELRLAHSYLITTVDEALLKNRRENLRKDIMPILQALDQDEDGNYYYEFPQVIWLEGIGYKGLMAQRRVSEFVNDESARELIDKHDLSGRCVKRVITEEIDYDELYACNQEGLISDDEVDSILEITETYALIKVKK